jgi:hypothetical protein
MTTVSPYSITGGRLFFSRRDAPARYSAAPAHSFNRSVVIEVTSSRIDSGVAFCLASIAARAVPWRYSPAARIC